MASQKPPKAPDSKKQAGASEGPANGRPPKAPTIPVLKPIYSDWALI